MKYILVGIILALTLTFGYAFAEAIELNAPVSGSPTFSGTVTAQRFYSSLTGDPGVTHGFSSTLGVGSDNVGGGNVCIYSSSACQWRVNGSTGNLESPVNRSFSPGTGDILFGAAGGIRVANTVMRNTAPTISASGTSPSVLASNGTASFRVDVGTGGTATGFTMTFPAAANRWICVCQNATTPTTVARIIQTTYSTTTCVMEQRTATTNVALAFAASDDVDCIAIGQ